MPQVYIILGPETTALFRDDEVLSLGEKLIPVVEEEFGISGKGDGAFTAVRAVATGNEAAIQIEIRYTAGEDEYGWGKPFEPARGEQKAVINSVKIACYAFFRAKGLPQYSVSAWINPRYGGVFEGD